LSLSVGFVYKPALAYDNKAGSFLNVPGMWRGNVSLMVDIPFVNLHTRAKH
jgi:hypothetical protein